MATKPLRGIRMERAGGGSTDPGLSLGAGPAHRECVLKGKVQWQQGEARQRI